METLKLGIDGLDDIEQIGAGGSSRVYRAKQVELDRLVALKVLKASDDPEVARRFDRERKAMGRLSLNEGIVPVYSSGITDRGEPYLIMPYYPNGSLQDRIEEGPVPWGEAVAYIASAAETMAAAHEADVVHLDLKPANILLSSGRAPRIADFGIAKLMSEQTASGNTGPAFTPTFTAPETLLGGDASPASDVYGLAATLWALIAGRPPFRAIDGEDNTLMAVVGRVVHQPAGDLRQLAPDPICSVIEIAMAKEPTDRYPTAGALRQALAGAVSAVSSGQGAAEQTVAAGPAGVAGAPPAGSAGAAHPGSAASEASRAQSSLQFDAAVPPRLVPAGNARAASLADAVDRYSGVIVGLGVAAILLVAVFLGQRLLSADETATSDSSTQVIEANETSSTALGAQAGAGGADNLLDDEPAGPTTTATTQPTTVTTAAATVSVTTTPTSATTEASTTTTTEETTSSSEETTSSTEDTTSTTETSTSSSETTETTTSSSSSSSSSSSTETTETTVVPIPRLDPPRGVTARFVEDRVIISWSPPAQADDVAGFTVLRDGAPINTTGPAGVRTVDLDVTPGESYVYSVRSDGPASGDPRNSLPAGGVEVPIPIDQDDPNANEPDDGAP